MWTLDFSFFGYFRITNSFGESQFHPNPSHFCEQFLSHPKIPGHIHDRRDHETLSIPKKLGNFLLPNISVNHDTLGHPLDVAGCFTAVTLRWMTPLASMSAERKLKARPHGIESHQYQKNWMNTYMCCWDEDTRIGGNSKFLKSYILYF